MLFCVQGQIPRHVSESDLRRLFDRFGPIQELVILRDKHTNAHRGCAFLTYHSRQSADEAIVELHEKISLHNRPMVVRYAGPHNQPLETKLFVGMLSRSTAEEAIEQLFGKYGSVKEVYLMRDAMQQSKGCAFVKMANRVEAETAITELNETYQDAGAPRKLVVRFADSKAGRLSATSIHSGAGGVAGGGYERADRGMYGVLMNGQQQWSAWGVPAHLQNPYASLYAAQQAQAQAQALARQQQSSLRGMYNGPPPYYSREQQQLHLQHMQLQQQQHQQHAGQQPYEPANTTVTTSATSTQLSPPSPFNPHQHHHQHQQQQQQQHNAFNLASLAASLPAAASPSPSPPRGPPGCNLFVYNIPDTYSDDDLLPLFSPYGAVVSVKVYRDKLTGVSRGFGFVSYSDSQAAERAIQALNGMQVNGKRLKVMLKKQGARGDGRGGEAAMAAGAAAFDMYGANNNGIVGLPQHGQPPIGRGYAAY